MSAQAGQDGDAGARFWAFSLSVYSQNGVKEACLSLQNDGADVNIALWCAWLCASGRDPREGLSAAIKLSSDWSHAVVKPLRAARDALKPAPGYVDAEAGAALRKQILKAELEAERLEQLALAPLEAQCPQSSQAGALTFETALAEALKAYAEQLNRTLDPAQFIKAVSTAVKKE